MQILKPQQRHSKRNGASRFGIQVKSELGCYEGCYDANKTQVGIYPLTSLTKMPVDLYLPKLVLLNVHKFPRISPRIKRNIEYACKQLKSAPKGYPGIVHIDISNFVLERLHYEIKDVEPNVLEAAEGTTKNELRHHTIASAVVLTWNDIILLLNACYVRMHAKCILHDNPKVPLPPDFRLLSSSSRQLS
jgi:hypothetical protein